MKDAIIIKGARTHNLKNIDVTIPRNQFTVVTGMSGSGKSSLAFDTIYAEGQRRYVESLSAYARQFLDRMDKPDVDVIEGLSPAVSVEQKSMGHNPRSTVGTVTEIYDYLRLLFARAGTPYCYQCGKKIEKQTVTQIVDRLLKENKNERIYILAPIAQEKKGEHQKELERLKALGFARVKVNGEILELSDEISLDKKKKHNIDVVIDRLKIHTDERQRLAESLESAFHMGEGVAKMDVVDENRKTQKTDWLSINNACVTCGISYPKIEPQIFSFNSPQGACETCSGLGELVTVAEELVVPNESISINEGAIVPWFGKTTNYYQDLLEALAKSFDFSLNTPFVKLSEKIKKIIFDGSPNSLNVKWGTGSYNGKFEGLKKNLMRRYQETDSEWMRREIVKFMGSEPCPGCAGARLKKESLFIRVDKHSIHDLTKLSLKKLEEFFTNYKPQSLYIDVAKPILREVLARLKFLLNVGLNYLSLERKSHTLSGGEAQRIRLATQIGSALVGVTYVLDEPSIGLHQRDNDRLIETLKNLRDIGNTVIVVEHDEETMREADWIVDLGPRSGVHGGKLVYQGDHKGLLKAKTSLTAQYLRGEKTIDVPTTRRAGKGKQLVLEGASENNLKNVTVKIPLGQHICVTGISGSGKSTLILNTLYPAIAASVYGSRLKTGRFKKITGVEHIDKIIHIDQSPIGRTPRSNPATYTGLFTPIRELLTTLPEAKARGYKAGRFSFNVKGGRCEACEGDGLIRIEMHFLPDVYIKCEACEGKRFNRETLEIYYKGKNIHEILRMSVEQATEFFKNIPSIHNKCETLCRVGLGYIELGQAATTLSGGEAQRIKLARELSKRSTGKTMYFLDEPTTGLHFEDIKFLLSVLDELVDNGNTVIVIEHNMHVIKTADHIIDLGPEGGDAGGEIIATGTPEEIVQNPKSVTGHYLKAFLNVPQSKKAASA